MGVSSSELDSRSISDRGFDKNIINNYKSNFVYVNLDDILNVNKLNQQQKLYLACRHKLDNEIIISLLKSVDYVRFSKITETFLFFEILNDDSELYFYTKLTSDKNENIVLKYNASQLKKFIKISLTMSKEKISRKCAELLSEFTKYEYIDKNKEIISNNWNRLEESVIMYCFKNILQNNKNLLIKFKINGLSLIALVETFFESNYITIYNCKGINKKNIDKYELIEKEDILLRICYNSLSYLEGEKDKINTDEFTKLIILCDRLGFKNLVIYLLNIYENENTIDIGLYTYFITCENNKLYEKTKLYKQYLIRQLNLELTYDQIVKNSCEKIDWLTINIKCKQLLKIIIEENPNCLTLNVGLNEITLKNFSILEINKGLNKSEELLYFVLLNDLKIEITETINMFFFDVAQKIESFNIKNTDMYNSHVNYYDTILNIWKIDRYNFLCGI